ncbi:MAG: TIGR02996 domain-containing protein [Planctomycetes bacterium]|nr:TIGR02996 domain-containing protein [Planctomycetota bacterium]
MANDPEYDALYAAVCAAPDDDAPRLVLADWLDEHNDPHRAAYIRAQVGLAQARAADPHAAAVFDFFSHRDAPDGWHKYGDRAAASPAVGRMEEFRKQELRYEKRAWTRWNAALPRRKAGTVREYERGFPLLIDLPDTGRYAALAEKRPGEPLPGYEFYLNSPTEEELDALLASGLFGAVRGLRGFRVESVEFVRKLGKLPAARNFRRLMLHPHENTTEILATVAAEPNWAGLTHLEMYAEANEANLPPAFFRAKHLRQLERLGLGLTNLTEAQCAALGRMKWPRLQALDIYGCRNWGAVGLGLEKSDFPELQSLDLMACSLGDAGATALAKCKELKNLATLNLTYNDIDDGKALAALIAGPAFPALAGLNLFGNKCRALDAKALASDGRGPTLRLLSLGDCGLYSKTAEALAAAPALTELVCLDLGGNNFGDSGVKALVRAAQWDRLRCLSLRENKITAKGVAELTEWPALANLADFDLRDNPIGLDGAKALAACKALRKCRHVALPTDERFVPTEGLKLLRETFGKGAGIG